MQSFSFKKPPKPENLRWVEKVLSGENAAEEPAGVVDGTTAKTKTQRKWMTKTSNRITESSMGRKRPEARKRQEKQRRMRIKEKYEALGECLYGTEAATELRLPMRTLLEEAAKVVLTPNEFKKLKTKIEDKRTSVNINKRLNKHVAGERRRRTGISGFIHEFRKIYFPQLFFLDPSPSLLMVLERLCEDVKTKKANPAPPMKRL